MSLPPESASAGLLKSVMALTSSLLYITGGIVLWGNGAGKGKRVFRQVGVSCRVLLATHRFLNPVVGSQRGCKDTFASRCQVALFSSVQRTDCKYDTLHGGASVRCSCVEDLGP